MADNYRERVCNGYDHLLTIDERLYEVRTDYQHLFIFKNRSFGQAF